MADSEQNINVVYPKKLLRKFIALYREQTCLWDRNCVGYKHKRKRLEAISKLTELVQEYDPGATRVHILRKIESLRACVRREFKRVQDSRQKAKNPDELYVPTLWYYDMLSFVFGEEANVQKIEFKEPSEHGSPENITEQYEEELNITEQNDEDYKQYNQNTEAYSDQYSLATAIINDPGSSSFSKIYPALLDEEAKKRHCTEIEDVFDAIGINVATKLRELPPNMRIIAEKLINDVLYQAQTNVLSPLTVVSTPDPIK